MGIKNVTKKTILYVDYSDVEDFINNYFGITEPYEIPYHEECGNNVILEFDVDGKINEYDKWNYEKALKEDRWSRYLTRMLLNTAASNFIIEKGLYMVRVSC